MRLNWQRLKMQQSADSADTSGASSGGGQDQSDSTATTTKSAKSFKALWKKAVRKLVPRRSRSTDEDDKASSPNANAGLILIHLFVRSSTYAACHMKKWNTRFASVFDKRRTRIVAYHTVITRILFLNADYAHITYLL